MLQAAHRSWKGCTCCPLTMGEGEKGTWLSLLPGGIVHIIQEDFRSHGWHLALTQPESSRSHRLPIHSVALIPSSPRSKSHVWTVSRIPW